MKLKYKAKNDVSAFFENTDLSKNFKAKVILRFGKLKIKTKHPKETFVFTDPNDCDLSIMTKNQQDRVNLILNAVLKANGRFVNYRKSKQIKFLQSIPAGFLRYKETRDLFLTNSSALIKNVYNKKIKLLNSFLMKYENRKNVYNGKNNLISDNNVQIIGLPEEKLENSNLEYSCKVSPNNFIFGIKDVYWKNYVFNKYTEHENFNELTDDEKDLIANWLNALLDSLNNGDPKILFQGNRKNFIETFPSDFLRYQEVRENFLKFAGEDYDYLADEKLEDLKDSLAWEKGERKLQDFDLQNDFYKK